MLEFSKLLEPISTDAPAGADVAFSPAVDAINKARQSDDPTLDQGEWVTAVKEADWVFVFEKCQDLLATQTKDLRIAGWLVEAATKTKQFQGMAAGFELLARLCDQYWESLHPVIDDGDLEQRAGNVRWLLGRSVQLVKEIPLTEGRGTEYAWIDFETARTRANNAAKTGEPIVEVDGQPSSTALEAVRRKSSKTFYESLIDSVAHCQAMLKVLEVSLDARLGNEGPSFSPLKDVLDTIYKTVLRYGADVGVKSVNTVASESDAGALLDIDAQNNISHRFSDSIKNRAHALEQLRRVAEFFRATEPHSPVAYLADKAATWGDLPLHSWLKTVVKDPVSLGFIQEMLGVKSTDEE